MRANGSGGDDGLKLPDADADPAVGGGWSGVVSGAVRDETGKQQGDAEQQGTTDSRRARVLRVLLGTLDGGVYSAAASGPGALVGSNGVSARGAAGSAPPPRRRCATRAR